MANRKSRTPRKAASGKKAPARRKAAKATTAARAAKPVKPAVAGRTFVARSGPETLRLRATVPSLTVDDLERSIRFYTDGLGFLEKERWKNDKGETMGVMLLAGICELGLSQDDWAKGRDRKKGVGFSVFCQTGQDIDALARRVQGAGYHLASAPKDEWDGRTFAVEDLDGFRLVFYREK
jgi:catechol 2,3-dioxygenase-like lactoylglutathione lyase family enzyme